VTLYSLCSDSCVLENKVLDEALISTYAFERRGVLWCDRVPLYGASCRCPEVSQRSCSSHSQPYIMHRGQREHLCNNRYQLKSVSVTRGLSENGSASPIPRVQIHVSGFIGWDGVLLPSRSVMFQIIPLY